MLTPEELQQHGLASPGEPSDLGVGEVGCDFTSDAFYAGILKAEGHDMAYWEERRDNFDEFTPNTVGSHQGFSGIAAGGKDQGVCRQIMEVGGGSVIVDITYIDPTGLEAKDPCADAMKIAQLVEPKLPA